MFFSSLLPNILLEFSFPQTEIVVFLATPQANICLHCHHCHIVILCSSPKAYHAPSPNAIFFSSYFCELGFLFFSSFFVWICILFFWFFSLLLISDNFNVRKYFCPQDRSHQCRTRLVTCDKYSSHVGRKNENIAIF